jgi:hypothetical protein
MRNAVRAAMVIAADELLGSLGLRRKQSISQVGPALGFFLAGALVGGAAALMFSPASGEQLFDLLEERLQEARERVRRNASTRGNGHNGKTPRARTSARDESTAQV